MGDNGAAFQGPDFSQGVDPSAMPEDSMLHGNVGGEPALLVRRTGEFLLIGSACTHYHGPLAEGLLVDDTVRCPWHHACFSVRTGEAVRAPALDPLPRWRLEWVGAKIHAREKLPAAPRARATAGAPRAAIIIGAGAAGLSAARTLRAEGFEGQLTLLSADHAAPYDRPNLSKDYLSGAAPEEWLPLRDAGFYESERIDLRLGARATDLLVRDKRVDLDDGSHLSYDVLLLATGAEPIRLPAPGAERPHVRYLRTLADSRALIKAAATAKRAIIIGASFIGLEVAASLRARNLTVHVVAPEAVPMERILGPELGKFVRAIHERHGVIFHLGDTVASIGEQSVVLASGETVAADLVVVGIGVRPALELAQQAGIEVDRGILVDEYLETSAPGVFAAGDMARWPDLLTGERIRVEHWVVAERQGQTAARNMLGQKERFGAAPFFWSQHYDAVISYVGHAPTWDRTELSGSVEAGDCTVGYYRGDRKLALASISRDLDSLRAEVAFEAMIAQASWGK
ncbi:MAG: FAD-dependent oxidoreductase [Methylocystis sp.]|nr:FAD-dependent oxidoreductase [Methylocystis sp.]